jgi:hypothetical protein
MKLEYPMTHANTVVVMQLLQNPPLCSSSTQKKPKGLVGSMNGYVRVEEYKWHGAWKGTKHMHKIAGHGEDGGEEHCTLN